MKQIMRKNKADGRKKKQGTMRGIAWILSIVLFMGSMNVQAFAGEVSESETTGIHTEATESSVSGADVPENKEENSQEPTVEAPLQEDPADMNAGAGAVIGGGADSDPAEEENRQDTPDMDSVSFNSISFNSMEIDMLLASAPVTFAYNGYPYGQISGSSITLTTALDSGNATDVAWYRADAKDGTYTKINGTANLVYSFTAQSGTAYWYKCQVNGQDTYPVQVVYGTPNGATNGLHVYSRSGMSAWYISNGVMAYTCGLSDIFDVVGTYTYQHSYASGYNGQTLWISTSYSNGWKLQEGVGKLICTFDPTNEHAVSCEASLSSGKTSFSIYADVCLGSDILFGNLADNASLKAILDGEKLTQIQMVGAESVDKAATTDPAFVLACPDSPSTFFVGGYSEAGSGYTGFNTATSSSGAKSVSTIGGKSVVTEVAGIDSGMAMRWTDVTGGKVRFNFNIGTVDEAGAQIKANAVVTSKTVVVTQEEGEIGEYEYNLRDKTTGNLVSDTWKVPDAQTRQVTFEDLTPNHSYEIIYRKRGSSDSGESAGDTTTAIDPLKPDSGSASGGETKPDVEVAITYHSISYNYLESNYQYRLLNEDNSAVTSWQIPTGTDGALTFDGLKPGVTYYLVAKTSSNSQTDKVPYTTDKVMVTYHANASDVSGLPQEQEFAYGDALSDTIPVKEGYDFLGWNIEAEKENTEARYGAGQAADIVEPADLYACWKIKSFSVTASDDTAFTVEGGNGTVEYGKSYKMTVMPRSGYILKDLTAKAGDTIIPAEQISYQEETGTYIITLEHVTEDQNVQIRCSYTTVLAQAAEQAKAELQKDLADKKEELQNLNDLSEDEKAQYERRLEEIEKNAEEQMDQLTDPADAAGVNARQKEAEEQLAACINDAKNTDLSNVKDKAKDEIAKKAEEEKKAIDALPDLTEEEKNELKKAIDDASNAARDARDAVTDPKEKSKVEENKNNSSNTISDTKKTAEDKDLSNARDKAKDEIAKKAEEEKQAIDELPDLTEEEKNKLKQEVDDASKAAKDTIDTITDPEQKGQIAPAKEAGDNQIADTRKTAEAKDLSNARDKAKDEIAKKAEEEKKG